MEAGGGHAQRGCQEIAPKTNQNDHQKGTLKGCRNVPRNESLSEPAETPETFCFTCVSMQKVLQSGSQKGARNGAKNDPEMDPETDPKRLPKRDQRGGPSAIDLKV